MATTTEVRVPDIGDFDEVPVIEILVASGDHVEAEQALMTLESDKASMDIPAPSAGLIKEIKVSVGDNVSEGSLLLILEESNEGSEPVPPPNKTGSGADTEPDAAKAEADKSQPQSTPPTSADASKQTVEVRVPDIGDFDKVPIVEILVSEGASVSVDDALVTLESDKAAMDVPSPVAGRVQSIAASIGDEVSQGDLLITLEAEQPESDKQSPAKASIDVSTSDASSMSDNSPSSTPTSTPPAERRAPPTALPVSVDPSKKTKSHATPSVRRFARELGVDLSNVMGTGRKGRIVRDDVTRHVKESMSKGVSTVSAAGGGLPTMPEIDFSKFGEVEVRPLSRIKKLSGANLHRAWLVVPHVTHQDEADITELEAFRKANTEQAKQRGVRLTPLAFIMKACVAVLQAHPQFNASLDASGENLILKHYFHLGVAVDTPDGLMVPVIRDVDKKGIEALAVELGEVSLRAREKKLTPSDLSGASFTISSLGGIGGTAFTPIVNAPEVAILGVVRSSMKPVYIDGEFKPRLMLPLSLSYDHRVIDGAAAARFTRHLCDVLTDIRRLLL